MKERSTDGLLIVDKPLGATSHEVVERVRRALGELRIGHTGTLDPCASGVLPLVLGRATRLARFLSASDKSYNAVLRLRVATDTQDAEGVALGPRHEGVLPSREAIERTLDEFRGTFLQRPPAFSAKHIGGRRSYEIARATARSSKGRPGTSPIPAAVGVTTHAVELVSVDDDSIALRVDCTAGFYVRALAHDLGEKLGVGAHLMALRRTRSGEATLDQALALTEIEREPALGLSALVPLSKMLPGFAPVRLTSEGVRHAAHGRDLGPDMIEGIGGGLAAPTPLTAWLRLVDPNGDLVALATQVDASGVLHPAVVLV